MELLEHGVSRAIRFVEVGDTHTEKSAMLIRGVADRYGFLQVPHKLEDMDLKRGMAFLHGYYRDTLIERLVVYETGVLVEAKADTDLSASMITDLLQWAGEARGEPFADPAQPMGTPFFSQVFVQFEPDVAAGLAAGADLVGQIVGYMKSYGMPESIAQISGFMITPDPASGANWAYRFERMAGAPYGENRFFSSGPMSTKDHISFLERLEANAVMSSRKVSSTEPSPETPMPPPTRGRKRHVR